jgi:ABC-type sugar transport system ATPase subunit
MTGTTAPAIAAPTAPVLRMQHITKRFPGVTALFDVTFDLCPGEVHCLVGENGAGKSTLIKILSGSYQADEGRIELDAAPITIHSPADGLRQGIGVVYQELELVLDLSVAENIYLGRELMTAAGTIAWRRMRAGARQILGEVGVALAPDTPVSDLTVAQAQLVAIGKVLSLRPRILVLDEPSAVLAGHELDTLFTLIRRLRAAGVGIVYISHRLEDIFSLGDRVTVLRDGRVIDTRPVSAVSEDQLIQLMVGRKVEARFPPRPASVGDEVLLSVHGLSTDFLQEVSFELHMGEILGFAGLVGAGLNTLAQALIGVEPIRAGQIVVQGRVLRRPTPRRALDAGLALVPEDRKGHGLILIHSVGDNMAYSSLGRYARGGVLRFGALLRVLQQYRTGLRVKTPTLAHPVGILSGGNQQKVVMAKALASDPQVLILNEPTRGVDVGAKAEFYQLIVDLAARGHGILLMSSELVEVTSLSHRLLVLSEGHLTAQMEPPYDDTEILRHALPASLQAVEINAESA